MNKLVIIGNGFDLAHGLKTRYEDFLLWYINEKLICNFTYKGKTEQLFGTPSLSKMNSVAEFRNYVKKATGLNPNYSHSFIKHLIDQTVLKNWVDIEREYYKQLVQLSDKNDVVKLNKSLEVIKSELTEYLSQVKFAVRNNEIGLHFHSLKSDSKIEEIYVLNFNYTSTAEIYISAKQAEKKLLNYIHGKLKDIENPIIFGYGDETDENYEMIEKLNDNEFLKHMKSFAYLQTPNYKNLFEFLDREDEKFEVHIMGHSCGLSDRLLFTHILEHPNLHSVKIYYYEKEDGTNDFFEKTQELSRYFRKDEKHKMRKVIVPFNESVPLVKYKLNEN
jgi:hypothetical protein